MSTTRLATAAHRAILSAVCSTASVSLTLTRTSWHALTGAAAGFAVNPKFAFADVQDLDEVFTRVCFVYHFVHVRLLTKSAHGFQVLGCSPDMCITMRNCGATSFTSGARRQGALAPQLPRVTRSPEFPSEHLFSFMDLRWSTGCLIFFSPGYYICHDCASFHPKKHHFSDLLLFRNCVVKEGHFWVICRISDVEKRVEEYAKISFQNNNDYEHHHRHTCTYVYIYVRAIYRVGQGFAASARYL